MQERITPLRSRKVVIVRGRARQGEPAAEAEESTTLIGAETLNEAVVQRTICSSCGAVLSGESVAAVCTSCSGYLCSVCSQNRCADCHQSVCWSCSEAVFGRQERYCRDHFVTHIWAFMIQFVFLFGILAGGMLGILHFMGIW